MNNKIIQFDCTNIITYKDYISHINELSKWYKKEYNKIKKLYEQLLINKNYKDSFTIIKKHNKLTITLINKVISIFNLNDKKIGIYLSNSFARETNLLDSDIDINFMYEDPSYTIYEELISSIIYQVVNKYRDFVHDSISHRLVSIDEKIDTLTYELIFKDKTIEETITKGNESMMYRLFNTKKDLNSFIKYYTEYLNNNDINEWIYFAKSLLNSNNYLTPLFDYIKLHEEKTFHFKINTYKDNLITNIKKELETLSTLDINDISIVKKYYKNHIFKYIYETLTLLSKDKKIISFIDVEEKLNLLEDNKLISNIKEYYSLIMIFNYLCDIYNLEFRTRYSIPLTKDFVEFCNNKTNDNLLNTINIKAIEIYNSLLDKISTIKESNPLNEYIFNPLYEHINIEKYSPLSHINNVSKCYQHDAYLLPYLLIDNEYIPIHPDTLDDLNISREEVKYYKIVYPTSSTRTVYSLEDNICLKIPVLRQITRSVRDVKDKEIIRSEIATRELKKYSYPNFYILEEECHKNKKEIYNYIIRKMPNIRLYPWFYLIVSNIKDKSFMIEVINKMINIWMFYASHGIYFESAHTQNFLVDDNGNIYYRDLSDIRILEYQEMCPSYLDELKDEKELHSIFFDRSVLSQNIKHFINYRQDITDNDILNIKKIINDSISKYNISFPDYSMNYDKNRSGHHPIRVEKSQLR